MIFKTDGVHHWWEFSLLLEQEGIRHAVFSRKGGMNLGFNEEGGAGYRKKVQEFLELDKLIIPNQKHGKHVEHFPHLTERFEISCDAVMTQELKVGLMIQHADCQASIFFDPRQRCVANVHCGWKGNIARIYTQVIARMQEQFGSKAEDIIVCISPSLGPTHAEFIHMKNEFPEEFWKYANEKLHIDLWQVSYEELLGMGILEKNIEIAKLCTYSDPEHFFSYRRDKTTGRNATVVALV